MLRKMLLGDYRPTKSVKDAAVVAFAYGFTALAYYHSYVVVKNYISAQRAEDKTFDDVTHPWNPRVPAQRTPDGTVAGVKLDDLKYTVWEDPKHGLMIEPDEAAIAEAKRRLRLNPSDYWEGNAIRGWGPAKPNPHPEGTPEHAQWAYDQDYTSF